MKLILMAIIDTEMSETSEQVQQDYVAGFIGKEYRIDYLVCYDSINIHVEPLRSQRTKKNSRDPFTKAFRKFNHKYLLILINRSFNVSKPVFGMESSPLLKSPDTLKIKKVDRIANDSINMYKINSKSITVNFRLV